MRGFVARELIQVKRALQIFGYEDSDFSRTKLDKLNLPQPAQSAIDGKFLKSWTNDLLPEIGKKIGFMKPLSSPLALAVFVTKGGVLKSTLTLNIARMAALHGIKTCVVGLDMQGDISEALNQPDDQADDQTDDLSHDPDSLEYAIEKLEQQCGLADLYSEKCNLNDLIMKTSIPGLDYIPETPELVVLDQSLVVRNRREYWLLDNVINPLKNHYDLVIIDCSPNWNRLITNALVAADALISPVECKINNFRNLRTFQTLVREFKTDMRAEFKHFFIATRLSNSRKLSREIFQWYRKELVDCLDTPIRESVQGEEAMAIKVSVPEYAPSSDAAIEIRSLIKELWGKISQSKVRAEPISPEHRMNLDRNLKGDADVTQLI